MYIPSELTTAVAFATQLIINTTSAICASSTTTATTALSNSSSSGIALTSTSSAAFTQIGGARIGLDDYQALKKSLRAEILAEALASTRFTVVSQLLAENQAPFTDTNVEEIEAEQNEAREVEYTDEYSPADNSAHEVYHGASHRQEHTFDSPRGHGSGYNGVYDTYETYTPHPEICHGGFCGGYLSQLYHPLIMDPLHIIRRAENTTGSVKPKVARLLTKEEAGKRLRTVYLVSAVYAVLGIIVFIIAACCGERMAGDRFLMRMRRDYPLLQRIFGPYLSRDELKRRWDIDRQRSWRAQALKYKYQVAAETQKWYAKKLHKIKNIREGERDENGELVVRQSWWRKALGLEKYQPKREVETESESESAWSDYGEENWEYMHGDSDDERSLWKYGDGTIDSASSRESSSDGSSDSDFDLDHPSKLKAIKSVQHEKSEVDDDEVYDIELFMREREKAELAEVEELAGKFKEVGCLIPELKEVQQADREFRERFAAEVAAEAKRFDAEMKKAEEREKGIIKPEEKELRFLDTAKESTVSLQAQIGRGLSKLANTGLAMGTSAQLRRRRRLRKPQPGPKRSLSTRVSKDLDNDYFARESDAQTTDSQSSSGHSVFGTSRPTTTSRDTAPEGKSASNIRPLAIGPRPQARGGNTQRDVSDVVDLLRKYPQLNHPGTSHNPFHSAMFLGQMPSESQHQQAQDADEKANSSHWWNPFRYLSNPINLSPGSQLFASSNHPTLAPEPKPKPEPEQDVKTKYHSTLLDRPISGIGPPCLPLYKDEAKKVESIELQNLKSLKSRVDEIAEQLAAQKAAAMEDQRSKPQKQPQTPNGPKPKALNLAAEAKNQTHDASRGASPNQRGLAIQSQPSTNTKSFENRARLRARGATVHDQGISDMVGTLAQGPTPDSPTPLTTATTSKEVPDEKSEIVQPPVPKTKESSSPASSLAGSDFVASDFFDSEEDEDDLSDSYSDRIDSVPDEASKSVSQAKKVASSRRPATFNAIFGEAQDKDFREQTSKVKRFKPPPLAPKPKKAAKKAPTPDIPVNTKLTNAAPPRVSHKAATSDRGLMVAKTKIQARESPTEAGAVGLGLGLTSKGPASDSRTEEAFGGLGLVMMPMSASENTKSFERAMTTSQSGSDSKPKAHVRSPSRKPSGVSTPAKEGKQLLVRSPSLASLTPLVPTPSSLHQRLSKAPTSPKPQSPKSYEPRDAPVPDSPRPGSSTIFSSPVIANTADSIESNSFKPPRAPFMRKDPGYYGLPSAFSVVDPEHRVSKLQMRRQPTASRAHEIRHANASLTELVKVQSRCGRMDENLQADGPDEGEPEEEMPEGEAPEKEIPKAELSFLDMLNESRVPASKKSWRSNMKLSLGPKPKKDAWKGCIMIYDEKANTFTRRLGPSPMSPKGKKSLINPSAWRVQRNERSPPQSPLSPMVERMPLIPPPLRDVEGEIRQSVDLTETVTESRPAGSVRGRIATAMRLVRANNIDARGEEDKD